MKNTVTNLYITETGNHYHRANCPFCKNRDLKQATSAMVRYLNLQPCKCFSKTDIVYMTAFIDESIRETEWAHEGERSKIGSYSYIICRGELANEKEISEINVAAKGVDYIGEEISVNHVAETAVGKVLLRLYYDFEFNGKVRVYTDNSATATGWKEVCRNLKLAELFKSVEVIWIPREENEKADKLGRERVLLDMPTNVYDKILHNYRLVNKLLLDYKLLTESSIAPTPNIQYYAINNNM